ncbi:SHIRT domain-containing protein [Anaerococcus ihuae]|uniref:SHIRT domain-containing protein n=1 Tax=Anaerococcus ihuae TaxID=2899519 RepID=UPI001F160679|nr:SHIRT domain-containing protein [Anaerococcus ihuae]
MSRENKNPRKILFSVLIAIAFVVLAGIKLGYADILSPKQGINEYHFYNDTIENKDSAKEIQKQIILDGEEISDPGHVFKDKDKVFLKWQDEDKNEIKFDTPIEIKGNDKKIIKVYPVFKSQVVITYYIVGDKNDRVYMTDTISDADSYKLPEDPTIYDANKYFVNWSTSKDGKSGVYDEESLKKDIAAGKTDIKLYAITDSKYKATFITGDDASYQDQIFAKDDGKLEKLPENPTREGYEFSHWSLKKDGDPVDLNILELNEDITVYAVWKPVVVDYKFKVMTQNIDDDGYTFLGIISARGLNGQKTSLPFKGSENPDPKVAPTGPIVEDISKLSKKDGRFSDGYNSKDENGQMDHTYTNPQTLDYLGFHLNEEKTKQAFETIEADGSTVVPVYMDRNVHTIRVLKNENKIDYYQPNWVNAKDDNGNIQVDLRYGQSSEEWFVKLNQDYIYYKDKSIGSFYTRAPAMGDEDIYMYRVYAKGTKYQLRFVEWDPSKFNAKINSSDLATLKSTLGTMKEIGKRISFQNSEWYYHYNGGKSRVHEPYQGMRQLNPTFSWVDETDHVDDIEGFEPKTGDMSQDGLQSINVNNPAFRDYMFAAGKDVGNYQNYTGTPYIEDGSYVGFLFYERKTYKINYYSGSKKLDSKPYKYEADTSDFGLDYVKGETTNSKGQVFQGWYDDSEFNVEHKHEAGAKMPAHNITVYAKWDSRKYEVTFHTNQDDYKKDIEKITEIPEDDTLYDGKYKDEKVSEENFPKPIQPKDATDFLGWYEKNKNGRFVKANLHKQIKNNDTHLYAKWKYAYLELKYDLNLPETDKVEGTAPIDSSSYITDAKAQVQDIGDVKFNGGKKVFVGWSETKDGSSGLIKPSETVLMDKNKTLYAQWKEIKDSSLTKVTYDPNGGKGSQYTVNEIVVEDFHKVLDNDKDENLKYTREGYAFKGWSRDKAATKAEFQADEEVNVNKLEEDKNNYIYAIWAPIINYTTDGNGQVKEGENFVDKTKEEVELNSNPKGTETKANEGYKFSHWTADKEITLKDGTKIPAGEKITEEQLKQAVITEPLTFTAHFVKDEFKVTHEFKVAKDSPVKEMPAEVKTAVDAQLPADKTAKDGETVTPTEPEKTKVADKENDGTWTFEGYKDQDKTTDEVDAKVNGSDVKFEGEWKFTPNEHKVTYEYVSGTEGKELPEELKAKAPKDVTGKVKGEKVTSPVPTGDDATFRDDKNKGTWTFKSYDKNEVEITNKDEKVTGTWVFTPDVVTEYVDEDGNTISDKETGTKDKKDIKGYEFVRTEKDEQGNTKHIYKKVEPTPDVVTEYVDEDGNTISDKETGTKDKKDIKGYEFVRTEKDDKGNTKHIYKKVTPDPEPEKYNVTHKFVSATEGKDLPKAVTDLTPDQQTGKKDGETVTPTAPKETTVEDADNDGTWKFEGYDEKSKTIDKSDVTFEGKWKFTPNEHKVTYEYVSGTKGVELPAELKAKAPAEVTGQVKGNTVTTPLIEGEDAEYRDDVNKGTWKFKSFDKDSVTISNQDEKVIGTWVFTPDVVTEYVDEDGNTISDKENGTKDKKDIEGYEFVRTEKDEQGNTKHIYKKVEPTPDVVTEYVDEDGNTISDKETGTKDKKDIKGYEFVRTEKDDKGNTKHIYKKVTPDPEPEKYNVTHKFVSATEGKDLPKAVTDLTPDQQTGKKDGETVTPTAPKETTVEDADNDGTWKFEGYDEKSKTIDKSDVTFEGKWKFTPNEHKVTYEYVSGTKGVELPAELKAKAPKDVTGKVKGDTVTSPVPEGKDAEFRDEANKGTWKFESYDKDSVKITNKDENVKGTWVFTKDPEPEEHKVTHKFVSKDPKKELPEEVTKLLPEDQTGKVKGDEVKPTEPKTKEVKVKDGTWKFVSYDKDSKTVEDKDVEFTGTWEFTPNPEPEEHKVIHKFVSKDPKKELPEEVTKLLPEDQTGKVKGDEVKPTEPKTKEVKVKDGTWKFVSYDKDKETVEDKDVEFTGTWEFIPEVVTEFVDEDGKAIAPKENGTKDKKDIEGYEFVETKTDEKGNTKHIYKKVKPTPEVVTEYVDEDGKTIAPKENGTKDKKDIEGYEFVETKTDEKGNTKHIYKKKTTPSPSIVTKFVDENGNSLAKDEDGKQDKKDIPAYEFVKTYTDKDGNIVHVYRFKQTPSPTVETRYFDTEGNQILADKAGENPASSIEGYQFVRTEKDEKGNTVHIYQKLAPVPKVETRYVDENGNQLLPPKQGEQGSVAIEGYNYIRTSKDNNGNTIHTYSKTPFEGVETRYFDTEGNQILADKAGENPASTIEGYQFVRTEKDEKGNTTHIYQKLAPVPEVETRYVDVNGNQLLPPKEGTQNQVNIDGYDYVSTNKDNNGNTIHVYKKKVITPDVVTKYVDENGNEIAQTQKGKNPSKNIEGYEIITTKTDDKGNIIYVYRKKPDSTKVVTKFVDEKGNPIAESEDGKKPKKDIKGYEFVKTETDKDGNTVHIYKKKENTSKVVTKFVDEKGNTIAESEDGKKPNKDIKGYEFVKTETDKDGNTVHIYKKKSSSTENKYKVTHKFESTTPGKSLPKEILDLLPKNQEGIENGTKVSPTKPSKLEVKVKDGTWVFEGYDKESGIIENGDISFTGKWKFVPNTKSVTSTSIGSKVNRAIGKSNVSTGVAGSTNVILVLMGSAFALYKNRKNKD